MPALGRFVLEIDRGLTENDVPLFTGYNDVLLNYRQLKSIFDKQIADWKNRLDCCNCIYLIQDKNNGKQYVGSTYGKEGIGDVGVNMPKQDMATMCNLWKS